MENIVSISIMAAGGVLLAVTVSVICGNRKLRRHKECCSRDPHVPGAEANKSLRQEIERRLERVSEIKYEPMLLSMECPAPKQEQVQYYCRMKALDHLNYLERQLSKLPGVMPRQPHETLRGFLLRLTLINAPPGINSSSAAVLKGLEPRLLHQLCDLHSHARYHAHTFTRHHLTTTHALMLRVLHCGRSGGIKNGSDDQLKAPSDHDSAIDTDPVELDPLEDYEEEEGIILTPPTHDRLSADHHQMTHYSMQQQQTQPHHARLRQPTSQMTTGTNISTTHRSTTETHTRKDHHHGSSRSTAIDSPHSYYRPEHGSLQYGRALSVSSDVGGQVGGQSQHHPKLSRAGDGSRSTSYSKSVDTPPPQPSQLQPATGDGFHSRAAERGRPRKSKKQRPSRLTIQDDDIIE